MKRKMLWAILILLTVLSCKKETTNDNPISIDELKINDIVVDAQNTKWFASDKGLYSLNSSGVLTNYSTVNQSVSNKKILSLKIEKKSSTIDELWIGTEDGLVVIELSENDAVTSATTYTQANSGLLSTYINTVFIDLKNARWFGTNNGLAVFGSGYGADKTKWLNVNSKNLASLKNQIVTAITNYGDTSFFIGTKGIKKTTDPSEKPNNMIHVKYNSVDGVTGASYLNWNGTYEDTVFCALVDKNKVRWTGTNNGLICHLTSDLKSFIKYSTSESPQLPDNHIYCIAQDSKGKVWIGTAKGAAWFDGVNWKTTTYTSKVNAIAFDKDDSAWIATDKGYLKLQ